MSCTTVAIFNIKSQISVLRVKNTLTWFLDGMRGNPVQGSCRVIRWSLPSTGTCVLTVFFEKMKISVMWNIQFYIPDPNSRVKNYYNSNSRWIERKSCSWIMQGDKMIIPSHGDTCINSIHRKNRRFHVMYNIQYHTPDVNFDGQKLL